MPAAAILSGGRSSRMGMNKALVDLNGITVIEYILARLQVHFQEIFIVTNEPELYQSYHAKVITDIYPRKGPIAGIHAALRASTSGPLFVLSCDMPFVNFAAADFMLQRAYSYDSVVPVLGGHLQPTAAVYNPSCLEYLTDCLENDKLKLTRVFEGLKTLYVHEREFLPFGLPEQIFFNINDQEALQKAREIAGRDR